MSQCPHINLLSLDAYVGGMPYEELAKVRQQGSMVYMDDPENGVPYWAVVKRDALDFVSQHPELFSSNLKGAFPMEVPPEEVEIQAVMQENIIIAMDPPKHMKYRKILRDAFTPTAVADMESWLRKGARQIVDRVAKKGRCEFVEEVAAELPLMAILELLGVPQEDRKQFFDWTNTMTFADDPDVATTRDEANAASFEVIAYAAELAAKQRENPTSPVVQALLNGEVDGEPVTEEMFAWMFILIMVGGNESTRTATSHGMRLLIEHPDQLQHLVDHPEDIPDAIEEMLRYNTAFIAMRRTATQDVEWNGHHIKKGDKVILHYHAVNHDEDVFGDDSLTFDIHRAKRMPTLRRDIRAFGIGEHFCLGMNLARMELKVIFEELIPRLRNPEFAGEVRYMRSFFINTIKAMPIRFDPEG
ncbi:cytochrome P450 [Spongiibacter tropicus]|uniref:cytochrome P450 n=1 Tax=Spongiibacter tropicus TaxID=454602 RepID=UPI0035BE47AE